MCTINRTFLILLLALLPATVLFARDYGFSSAAALAGGYNTAWGSYGGADVKVSACAGGHLEASAVFEGLTSGIYAMGLNARPKLQLEAGTLYLDGGVLYRTSTPNRIFDFVSHGSIGWQMKHLDARVGLFTRTMGSRDRDIHTTEEMVTEPFNLLYRLQYKLKGDASRWDLWGGVTDCSDFEYERHWEPYFFLGGRYALDNGMQLFLQTDIKPAGMFHLNASFYGVLCRAGVFYSF